MNKLFYNLLLESGRDPVKRLNPSVLSINTTHNYFKSFKSVSNELYSITGILPKNDIKKLHYTYLTPYKIFQPPKEINTLFVNALDISCIDYNFNSYTLPTYYESLVRYLRDDKINIFNKELELMKQYYNITTPIDCYKISNDVYIFFDDKYNIISEEIIEDTESLLDKIYNQS